MKRCELMVGFGRRDCTPTYSVPLADRCLVRTAKAGKLAVEQMNYVRHYILEDGAVI